MATILRKLRDEGWHLSKEGYDKVSDNGAVTDVAEIRRRALDTDLKELINANEYPSNGSTKLDFGSGLVLQIINVRNMSAPIANQESKTSPRLLQVDVTDGQTCYSGIEIEHLPAFNINIAPGTKVLLRNTLKTAQGIMLLSRNNIDILGGKVAVVYEKWEANRAKLKFAIGGNTAKGETPPWIPFGQKSKLNNIDPTKPFKSPDAEAGAKEKESSKQNVAFLAMRNEAIAEAMQIGTKKVFGGGNRQLVDHNVKKILDKGYTEDDAKYALKMARNNLERAMSNLKRSKAYESEPKSYDAPNRTNIPDRHNGSGRGNRGNRNESRNEEAASLKPSSKVSLFDFLQDKIDVPEVNTSAASVTASTSRADFSQSKTGNSVGYSSKNNEMYNNGKHNKPKFENTVPMNFTQNHNKFKKDENSSQQPFNKFNKGVRKGAEHLGEYENNKHNSSPLNHNRNHPHNNYNERPRGRTSNQMGGRNTSSSQAMGVMHFPVAKENVGNNFPQGNASSNFKKAFPQLQTKKNKQSEELPQSSKAQSYNPYKIMGFRNKESNEFAINMLKTQGADGAGPTHMNPPKSQTRYEQVPKQQVHSESSAAENANGADAFFRSDWTLKIGDRCLAKYWEDGQYYNAEIRAVADKTCVVYFLDYGNAEEVLLEDCLPICDANYQPVNFDAPQTKTKSVHASHQQQQPRKNHGFQYQPHPQERIRNDRQVYVPPAQRNK